MRRVNWNAVLIAATFVTLTMASNSVRADEGPLKKDPPQGITPEEIIKRFAEKEKEFKQERESYGYRQIVKAEELDGDTVTADYQEIFDISFDDKGNKIKTVVFAPQPSITNMTREDFDDIENRLPFTLSTDEVGAYNLLYVGQQSEDELQCYVFDIAPKEMEKGKRYFQGRIWVDNKDFQIVKNYGKSVPDTHLNKKGKGQENLFPKFTTWREQVDGKFWFPTYSYADDVLHFVQGGDLHVRETVKYTDYKKYGSKVKITYEGKEVEKGKEPSQPTPPDDKSKP